MSVGYWYICFENAPTQFFRDEEVLTEDQWRTAAPEDQVAKFDAEQLKAKGGVFPKDIAAS